MNVLFSSDNNYAQHLGVAMYSLLDKNREMEEISIYIVDNGITEENKRNLIEVVDEFSNASIHFISFDHWKQKLHLNLLWPISLSSYARLFMASMLPVEVEKVLYLDCDMIVCDRLADLWNTDMHGYVISAVQDYQSDVPKLRIGLQPSDAYFNAGMLLVDLKAWRDQSYEEKCLKFIEDHEGNVFHHDQGVLNGVFRGIWYRLPINYNLMTLYYFIEPRKIKAFCKENSPIGYLDSEIIEAKAHPSILHFTPSLTTRPWVKTCKHPLRKLYWNYVAYTPWAGVSCEKDKSRWYVKMLNWYYRNVKISMV